MRYNGGCPFPPSGNGFEDRIGFELRPTIALEWISADCSANDSGDRLVYVWQGFLSIAGNVGPLVIAIDGIALNNVRDN